MTTIYVFCATCNEYLGHCEMEGDTVSISGRCSCNREEELSAWDRGSEAAKESIYNALEIMRGGPKDAKDS